MKKIILTLFILSLIFNSCSSNDDSDNSTFNGSLEDIREYYNEDLVDALNDLGFNINTGNTPPNVEGVYFVSPLILQASSVASDIIGARFNDYTITLTNQNNEDLTIDYLGDQGLQVDLGGGSFISGDNNNFSIFLITTSTNQINEEADSAIAISGTFTEEGVEGFQIAYMMLDNKENPSGTWIPNNSGRVVHDSDGFSPKQ
jgi:hypothetical protein